jgi:hypothetical protein
MCQLHLLLKLQAFCFKISLSFYTNSRRTFSASALDRFILTADAIEDSLTSDNCSTNSSFFFLISELTFLKERNSKKILMSDTREKRTRQLTIKGQTMFDEQQEQLRERGENIWIKIEDILQNGDNSFCNRLQYLCLIFSNL